MASSLPFSAGVKSASRILLSGRNGGWGPSFPFTNGAGACYNERRPTGRSALGRRESRRRPDGPFPGHRAPRKGDEGPEYLGNSAPRGLEGEAYAKVQCEKAVYRPGLRDPDHRAGIRQPQRDADGPAAGDEPALPPGGDHLSRRQPGAGGGRRDEAPGGQPLHPQRGEERHQPEQRELQPRHPGVSGRHQYGQRPGEGQHRRQPDRGEPAGAGGHPHAHRDEPGHDGDPVRGGGQPGDGCLRTLRPGGGHHPATAGAAGRRGQRQHHWPRGADGGGDPG